MVEYINIVISDKRKEDITYLYNYCLDNCFKVNEIEDITIETLVEDLNNDYKNYEALPFFRGVVISIKKVGKKLTKKHMQKRNYLNDHVKKMTVQEFIEWYEEYKKGE